MKQFIRTGTTPQRKIIQTNDGFGNRGIKQQQGTTRILYDSLPIDGSTEFRFFEGANNRDFPRTNMGASGNQLNVGETIVFERAYLMVTIEDPVTFEWTIVAVSAAAFPDIVMGELNLAIANSQVLKPIPIASFEPTFNKNATYGDYNNFEFDTQLILPPLLEFVSILRVPIQAAVADADLRLTYEGVGAIIAPRRTF